MRKFLLILIFAAPLSIRAQYWEIGAIGGIALYSGDLTENLFDLKEIHPTLGGVLRYNINEWFTMKSNFYHGVVSGNDKNAKTQANQIRNLSFKSTVLDIGFNAEINLAGYKSGHPQYNSSPYVFFGLSVFRFNPKALYMGEWYALQPLGTEGQGTTKYNDREKYALTQICIPIGGGWKYAINRYWNIGVEIGPRFTFTDYIDDVSTTYVEYDILKATRGPIAAILSNRTGEILPERIEYTSANERGDPTKNDIYVMGGVIISYSIFPNQCYRF